MNRWMTFIVLGACVSCFSPLVEAHGNLGLHVQLPPGWAILAYFLSFILLFLAVIAAASDESAALWLRVGAPSAMFTAIIISAIVAGDRHSIRAQLLETFAALSLPALFAGLWLLGVIQRWRQGG